MTDTPLLLVDTSAWIAGFRPGASGGWVAELRLLLQERQVAVNPLIRLELLSGARTDREYRELADTLSALTELELTPAVWEESSRLGFLLRRRGLTIPTTDIVIASSAVVHRCTLRHQDRHFSLIAKHSALRERSP